MKHIFVILNQVPYEEGYILGAYLTEEEAKAACKDEYDCYARVEIGAAVDLMRSDYVFPNMEHEEPEEPNANSVRLLNFKASDVTCNCSMVEIKGTT
jgi:hypothetical protein